MSQNNTATSIPVTAPTRVVAMGTVNVKHPDVDLAQHIAAIKGWRIVTTDGGKGTIITAGGHPVADCLGALADKAREAGWIRDYANSRHIYWELITVDI